MPGAAEGEEGRGGGEGEKGKGEGGRGVHIEDRRKKG